MYRGYRHPITTERVATWSAQHSGWTIGFWLAAVLLAVAGWRAADGELVTGTSVLTETDSRRGGALIRDRFAGSGPTDTRVVCAIPEFADIPVDTETTAGEPDGSPLSTDAVTGIGQCYEAKWAASASAAGNAPETMLADDSPSDGAIAPGEAGPDNLTPLLQPELRGSTFQQQNAEIDERVRAVVREDLIRAERIAIPLTLVILVLVIRARFSPFIPILIGGVAVAVAVGMTTLLARFIPLSIYVLNMIVMLGLAVGIDYTLLIFERYREERRSGAGPEVAIASTSVSAGHAVLASGMTVVVALAGILFVPISVFRHIALGAMLVVLLGVLAALTLLPAMLRLLGERIDLRRRSLGAVFSRSTGGSRFWERWADVVTRHPVRSAGLALLVLGALAFQVVDLQRGLTPLYVAPDTDDGPPQMTDYWEQEVTTTLMSVVEIVVDGTPSGELERGIERLVTDIGQDNDFTPIVTLQANDAGNLTVVRALVVRPSSSTDAARAVERLRTELVPDAFATVPTEVYVTGPLAVQRDVTRIIETWQPRIVGFVLGMSVVILVVVFRSAVVPLVAALMTLLSVSAAIGTLVLVAQKGYGASLLGLEQTSMIEVWVPIVLFSILFGLSMDYHVFLLSRVQEHYRRKGDTTGSIAFGVRSTGTIISGAALIMVIVFASFASGQVLLLQQIGFGLAVAILIDAFLVRLVLVPAVMTLLGRWNWYLPGWLGWLPGGK